MKTVDAINLALNLLLQSQRISLMIQQAHAEGRTQLRSEESAAIRQDRNDALAELDRVIEASEKE